MALSRQFSLFLLIAIGSSFVALGDIPVEDACNRLNTYADDFKEPVEFCKICVDTLGTNKTCVFGHESDGYTCINNSGGERIEKRCLTVEECIREFSGGNTTTIAKPPDTTTITPVPTTTNGTTTTGTPPTTTNATTTSTTVAPPTTTNVTTTTTPAPSTNGTTTTAAPSNGTTVSTTQTPGTSSTTAKTPTTAAPSHGGGGGFGWGSFFGGIAFTAAMAAVAYIVFRFYKVRTERNYHTLTTNLI